MSDAAAYSSGANAMSILGIVFVTLKLLGYIDWSWWWVLAPFWVPSALGLVIALPLMYMAFKPFKRD